jgi:hypothetical protein
MSATTEQKTANGWLATTDTTTDNGTTVRTMVRDIGDGTSSEAPTPVHKNHPHVRTTHATERDASSAMVCHGDKSASATHAAIATEFNTRWG